MRLKLSTEYSYTPHRFGLSVRHDPSGREIYFQPGDDESTIRDTIDALHECDESTLDAMAHVALSDYFA